MKRDEIFDYLNNTTSLLGFDYHGKHGYVDPFSATSFDLFFDEETISVDSIDEVMNTPFFDGKSLDEIADDIEITER